MAIFWALVLFFFGLGLGKRSGASGSERVPELEQALSEKGVALVEAEKAYEWLKKDAIEKEGRTHRRIAEIEEEAERDLKKAQRTIDALRKDLVKVGEQVERYRQKNPENDPLSPNSVAQLAYVVAQNEQLRESIEAIANAYVNDAIKNICQDVTAYNHEASKKRLDRVFQLCRKHNLQFSSDSSQAFYQAIDDTYKNELLKLKQKEQQARIRERQREEERAERERQAELRRLEEEKKNLRAEYEHAKAMAALKAEYASEKAEWEAKMSQFAAQLTEREEKERTISNAEVTKAGHIYVISNIGSFGERVFKVGMTRRSRPEDRIKELSDASVPYPFDVHMLFACENAPEMEGKLHESLWKLRMNKANDGKEFFRVDLDEIQMIVEKLHGKVACDKYPKAEEYRETLAIEDRGDDRSYDSTHEVDDEVKVA